MFRKRFEYVSPPLFPSVRSTLSLRSTALCSIPYEVLYVIAKHRFAVLWQSPGRVTILCAVCAVRKGILVIALFLTK